MADSEIAGLTEDTTPDSTDNVYVQDAAGAVDKRVPLSALSTITTTSTTVNAAGAVMESDYNALTMLHATSDNTPVPVSVTAAALTVLDDTTTGAMLTTLGGVANTGTENIAGVKTFTTADSPVVVDEAFGDGWNGDLSVPTKNAIYDAMPAVHLRVPGLVAWHYAQGIADAGVADDTALDVWPDRSGNNYPINRIGGTTTRPTLQTSEANGQACVRFDGSNDYMLVSNRGLTSDDLTQFNFLHAIPSWTYIGVLKTASDVAASGYVWGTSAISGSVTGASLYYDHTNKRYWCGIQNGSAAILTLQGSNNSMTVGTTHLVVVRVQVDRSGASNDGTLEVDGVQVGAADFTATPVLTQSASPLHVGQPGTSSSYWKGDIFEQMWFGRRLTDAEVLSITGALETTYGL